MATIIEFSSGKAAAKPHSAKSRSKAEIVIFPGVRYERAPASDPDRSAAPTSGARDTLVIPD